MKQTIINLKERINKNYKKIKRKNLLTKIILEMINQLINNKASNEEIYQWLKKYDNTLFVLNHNLKEIEQKSKGIKD